MKHSLFILSIIFFTIGFAQAQNGPTYVMDESKDSVFNDLSDFQKKVMCGGATEKPFTGKYLYNKSKGVYSCAACENPLFTSDTKFDSGSGWPSFFEQIDPSAIDEIEDNSYGMKRVEIVCSSCQGHLGHVFEDGPPPTGLRYCVNSASLFFKPTPKKRK